MRKTIFTLLIIFAAIFFIKPWSWHVHFHKNHKTLTQQLELTKEQVEFEKLLRKENQIEINKILIQLEPEVKSYKHLIAIKANTKIILEKKEIINKLDEKYNNIQKNHMIQFEKILTKEQKDKFKQIRTKLFINDQ